MADYSIYKLVIGDVINYPGQYDDFVTQTESVATEIENAREGEVNLITNLTNNYAKYNLSFNLDGNVKARGTADIAVSNSTTLVDTGADFSTVQVGDIIVNATDGISTTVSTVNDTTDTITTPTISPNTWSNKLYSIGGFKCTNMQDAVLPGDYATKAYLDSLTGSAPTSITSLDVGTLLPNDILVVNSAGTAITGRPTEYRTAGNGTVKITGAFNASQNDNIWFNVASSNFTITLPGAAGNPYTAPVPGDTIYFSDVEGSVTLSNFLTINPGAGYKILNQALGEVLVINDFSYISFGLVYVSAAFGWALIELQR